MYRVQLADALMFDRCRDRVPLNKNGVWESCQIGLAHTNRVGIPEPRLVPSLATVALQTLSRQQKLPRSHDAHNRLDEVGSRIDVYFSPEKRNFLRD